MSYHVTPTVPSGVTATCDRKAWARGAAATLGADQVSPASRECETRTRERSAASIDGQATYTVPS
ncbi:MAG: hypothetical protein LC713_03255, partial [Actinobacteria bacterium]|nr:hypothetical protein [Actinomycetota bacterium]